MKGLLQKYWISLYWQVNDSMRFAIQIGASLIVVTIFVGFIWFAKIANWPTWVIGVSLFVLFVLFTVLMTFLSLALQPKKQEDEHEED